MVKIFFSHNLRLGCSYGYYYFFEDFSLDVLINCFLIKKRCKCGTKIVSYSFYQFTTTTVN